MKKKNIIKALADCIESKIFGEWKHDGFIDQTFSNAKSTVENEYKSLTESLDSLDEIARQVSYNCVKKIPYYNHYSNVIQQLTKTKLELELLKKNKEKQLLEIKYLEEKLNEHRNVKLSDNDMELESDISVYKKYAEKNQEYYSLLKQKSDIKHKIKLLNKTLTDNEQYSIRLLNEEEIRCPVCKSDITDFISSALTIGMAESDINSEVAELKAELLIIERKLAQIKPKLDLLHSEISQIEEVRQNLKVTRAVIVWNEELQEAKKKFAETQLQMEALENTLKGLNSKIRTYNDRKKIRRFGI